MKSGIIAHKSRHVNLYPRLPKNIKTNDMDDLMDIDEQISVERARTKHAPKIKQRKESFQ